MSKKYYYKFVGETPVIYYVEDNMFSTVSVRTKSVETKKDDNVEDTISRLVNENGFKETTKEYLEEIIKTFALRRIQEEQIRLEERILELKKEAITYLYNNISYL